jgi:hypothetical protein
VKAKDFFHLKLICFEMKRLILIKNKDVKEYENSWPKETMSVKKNSNIDDYLRANQRKIKRQH